MNNRALTLSLLMAGFAVFFVYSYVASIEEAARKRFGSEVIVITAKKDVKEMETLNETHLDRSVIPKKFLEPASVHLTQDQDEASINKAMKEILGLIAVVPIKKGEQITYNKLTEAGLKTGLAPQISPGRRAVAIPVGEISGISKLIKPGDRVDLIAIFDFGAGKEKQLAKTVLQDVLVLSIGRYVTNNVARTFEADPSGGKDKVKSLAEDFSFSSVTLEVDPIQAQTVALVQAGSDGGFVLSLRNNDDTDRINHPPTSFMDVLGPDAARVMKETGAPGVRR